MFRKAFSLALLGAIALSAYGAAIRSSTRTKRADKDFSPVANAVRGGIRYDWNLTSRSFAFGYGDRFTFAK